MELGVYSFGNGQQFDGKSVTTGQAIKNLLEAIQLADKVGLDFFGVGEHHTRTFSGFITNNNPGGSGCYYKEYYTE